jgi:hypothetical protein
MEYTENGKNNGTITLAIDGSWMKVVWKNRADTYETTVAVPLRLVARFAAQEIPDEYKKEAITDGAK